MGNKEREVSGDSKRMSLFVLEDGTNRPRPMCSGVLVSKREASLKKWSLGDCGRPSYIA
jgi:hypothetical protein